MSAAALMSAVAVMGAVCAGASGQVAARAPTEAPDVAQPCGTITGRPVVDEVLLIWEENHDYGSVMGNPAAPEINDLAARCGLATRYGALTHPSLPNYMEMTSGQPFTSPPWTADCEPAGSCTTLVPSVFSELGAAGHNWRSYVESMSSNCGLVSSGEYAARHNPAVYYTGVRPSCHAWDRPMGTVAAGPLHQALLSGPTVGLTTVTPDLGDDMHDGTLAQGDHWLSAWVPRILASPGYRSGHLAVLIVWDEGAGSGNTPSHVPLIVMSASTPAGARSGLAFDDYSVLRAICQLNRCPGAGRRFDRGLTGRPVPSLTRVTGPFCAPGRSDPGGAPGYPGPG